MTREQCIEHLKEYLISAVNYTNTTYGIDLTDAKLFPEDRTKQIQIDTSTKKIRINNGIIDLAASDNNVLEATKVFIGHELGHCVFQIKSGESVRFATGVVSLLMPNYNSASIVYESRCDFFGKEIYEHFKPTGFTVDVKDKFKELADHGVDAKANVKYYIRRGYLPGSLREEILTNHGTYSDDVITDVIDTINPLMTLKCDQNSTASVCAEFGLLQMKRW